MGLILQEVSQERFIDIPEPVLEALSLYRPSPLYRAHRLEKALGTPAKIYYKYEGVSPAGSHKPSTAIAQAYYKKEEGVRRLTTETGAGQWGSAISYAAQMFGLECKVYMVCISFNQKPYRKAFMKTFGADTKYSLGSVLNHVPLHQTIIGQEAMKQMEIAGDLPDMVIGCVGGGSNFSGLAFPFVRDKINGKDVYFVVAEPATCPTLTKGEWRYDFGDTMGMTPLVAHVHTGTYIHAGAYSCGWTLLSWRCATSVSACERWSHQSGSARTE